MIGGIKKFGSAAWAFGGSVVRNAGSAYGAASTGISEAVLGPKEFRTVQTTASQPLVWKQGEQTKNVVVAGVDATSSSRYTITQNGQGFDVQYQPKNKSKDPIVVSAKVIVGSSYENESSKGAPIGVASDTLVGGQAINSGELQYLVLEQGGPAKAFYNAVKKDGAMKGAGLKNNVFPALVVEKDPSNPDKYSVSATKPDRQIQDAVKTKNIVPVTFRVTDSRGKTSYLATLVAFPVSLAIVAAKAATNVAEYALDKTSGLLSSASKAIAAKGMESSSRPAKIATAFASTLLSGAGVLVKAASFGVRTAGNVATRVANYVPHAISSAMQGSTAPLKVAHQDMKLALTQVKQSAMGLADHAKVAASDTKAVFSDIRKAIPESKNDVALDKPEPGADVGKGPKKPGPCKDQDVKLENPDKSEAKVATKDKDHGVIEASSRDNEPASEVMSKEVLSSIHTVVADVIGTDSKQVASDGRPAVPPKPSKGGDAKANESSTSAQKSSQGSEVSANDPPALPPRPSRSGGAAR